MASPVKLYQREMHNNLGYFATWLPSDGMELGDVGVLQGGRFHKLSSLRELGVNCTPGPLGKPQSLNYSSTAETRVNTSAGASAPGLAQAEISIKMSRQGAFAFQAAGVQSMEIHNRAEAAAGILRAFEKHLGKKNGWSSIHFTRQSAPQSSLPKTTGPK